MSRSSSFLATSSVAEHRPLRLAGRTLLREHGAIELALRTRDQGLADFFAEPLLAGAVDAPIGNISWYCAFDHSSQTLAELSDRRREAALNRLRERLQQALSLIEDPELGPTLQAMLVVPSAHAIRFVGTEPVLIDWAVAPAGVDDAPASWQAQFNRVFEPVCGVRWPQGVSAAVPAAAATPPAEPATDHAGPAVAAAALGAAALPLAGAAAQPSAPPDMASATSPAADAGADAVCVNPAAGAAGHTTAETAASAAGGSAGTTGTSGTIGTAGVAADGTGASSLAAGQGTLPPAGPAVLPTPWYYSAGFGLVAAGVLLVLLGALLWWLLWAPGGLLVRPQVEPPASQHARIVEGLQTERDRLLGLNELACGPEFLDAIHRGFVGPLSVPPAVDAPGALPTPTDPSSPVAPEAGQPAALPPVGTQGEVSGSSLMALARRLERSVVMVLGSDGSSQSMGTGFFITPDTVVTNHHVVESVDPSQLWVTSQFLGEVRPARVIALTRGSEIGEPDFAVLRVQGAAPANVVPLPIVNDAPKLARVITAGFPTYIAQSDPSLHALLRGDSRAAPAMVFTSGEVSVVQAPPRGARIIVHTADMSQGSSGGPLVDLCGRVAGVNTFIGTDGDSGRRGLYSLAGGDLISFLKASNVAFQQAESACIEGGVETAAAPE